MSRKPRPPRPPAGRRSEGLAQYGLFDMPEDIENIEDGNESDLEAELAALSGGSRALKSKSKPKSEPISQNDLDALVAESMKDVPTDEEISDGEDDPDILNELSVLTNEQSPEEASRVVRPAPPVPTLQPAQPAQPTDIVALLQERIEMYTIAEQNAKENNESGRARRFNRGLKTLKDQLKLAKAGKPVNEEEIPPLVSTAKHNPPATTDNDDKNAPSTETHIESNPILSEDSITVLNILNERKNQYKNAALIAKKSGDNAVAMNYLKTVKQFDRVIDAVNNGQPVDLSNMPAPPDDVAPKFPNKQTDHIQNTSDDPTSAVSMVEIEEAPVSLITASSVMEALQQRLTIYKEQEAIASEAGNSSKARRMGRIVKQYEQAIKLNNAGKPIPYDELPTPPGYAPIPGAPQPSPEEPTPPVASSKPQQPSLDDVANKPGKLANTGRSNSVRKMGNQIGTSLADRQLSSLLQRQREFKEAALDSKKKGEIKEAKEYLRCAKGLEPLIEAAKGGFPVDLSTIPLPPQAKQELEDTFDVITSDDCDPDKDGTGDILGRLEEQLNSQLKLCLTTRDHHKALGDVAGTNRFEHLALNVKQDLDVVKLCKRTGGLPPKFHYETKQFSIVQCCTDLGDNDLELMIVRGINYTVANPKDVDTYVKFEFPYPQEEPVRDKTGLLKDTNNPEYNATFTLPINRQSRPCLRVFKRHAIKLEVFSRGCCGHPCSCPLSCFSGFFTRDSLIGAVTVKLQPLETQTVLHESFDLMDGRKTVGGKLEVKIRVRHPLLSKQVEQITQKWLIIDH